MNKILLLLTLVLFFSCSNIITNPEDIKFQNVHFRLRQEKIQNLLISENDTLNIGLGDIIIYDFNKDQQVDFCVYKKNDDFQDHFGYIDIYLNLNSVKSVNDLIPEKGKFKEGHWTWINTEKYSGLNDSQFMNLISGIQKNI